MDPSHEEQEVPTNDDQRATRPKSSKLPKSSNNQRDKSNNRAGSPPQDTSIHDVRQAFQVGLNKIANNQTREIGLKEIQGIIMTNNSPINLRVYFGSLKDLKRHHDAATKEVEVLIFGYIATVYKTNLLDPLDKPPNLLKSVVRLCESIHSYFKDTNQGVQIACAKALTEVYLNCLQDEATDICSLIIVEPLLSILNGGADRATQQTAAYCLKEAIKVFQMKQKTELLDYTAPRAYNLFLKTNHDFAELLEALSIIIFKVGIRSLQGKYTAFADKLCSIVNSQVVINQYYLIKVEACGVLLAFAYALRGAEVEQKVLDNLYEKVTSVLKDASKNKIYKVQQAASEALKFWNALKSSPENAKLEVPALARQTEQNQITEQSEPDSKKNPAVGGALNNFKAIRNRFKQGKIGEDNNPPEPEPNTLRTISQEPPAEGIDLVNAKYGSQNRGKNFMKARSGFGGGHIGWNSPERGEGKKVSHEKQKKNIRDLIMQKQLGGDKKSKFEFVAEEAIQKHKAETGAAKSKSPIRDEESEKKPVPAGKRPQSQSQKKYVEPKENSMDSSFKDVVLQSQNNDVRSQNTGSSRAGELRGNDSQNIDDGEDGDNNGIRVSRNASLRSETSAGANQKTIQKARPQTASQRAPPQDLKKERGGSSSELQKNVVALEGKLASILGKSQQELTAEIQERAAQNRKLKNNAKQATSQSRDLPIYKLAKEDERIVKAMTYMDSSDFPSEANGIDPYTDEQNKREFASPERNIQNEDEENENEAVSVSHKKIQQREKYGSQAPDPKSQQKAVELEDDEAEEAEEAKEEEREAEEGDEEQRWAEEGDEAEREAEEGDEEMETAGFGGGGGEEDLFQVEEMDQGDQGLLSWGKEKYNQAKKAIGLGPKEDKTKDEKTKAPEEESKKPVEESKKPEVETKKTEAEQKVPQKEPAKKTETMVTDKAKPQEPETTKKPAETTVTEKSKPQEPESTKKPAEEPPKKSEDKKVETKNAEPRETEEIEEVTQKKEKKGGWLKNSMEWTKDKIGLGKNSRSPSPEKAQKDSAKTPEKEIPKSPEKEAKEDEVVQKEKKGGWLKNSMEWTKDHIGIGKKSRSPSPEKGANKEEPAKNKKDEVKTQENANEKTEATVSEETAVQNEKKGGWLKNSMEWTKDKIGLGKNSRSPSPEKAQKEVSKSPEKGVKNDPEEEGEEVQKKEKKGWLKESMEWTKDKIGLGKKSRSPSPEKDQNQPALPIGVIGGLAKGVQPAKVAKESEEVKAKEPTKSQTDARMINIIKKYQQNESPKQENQKQPTQPQLSQTQMKMKNLINKNYAQEPEGIDDSDEEEQKAPPQVKKQYEDRPIRPMTDQQRMMREYFETNDVDYNEEDYEQPVTRENENKSLRASDERLDREINEGVRQNLGLSPIPHEHEEDDSEKLKKNTITKNGQDLPTIRESVNDDQSREDMRDSLKDSLMPALRTHFIKNRGGSKPQEVQEDSPSIDDISDTTPKNNNQSSKPGVIRAPQKQVEPPIVEMKHSGTINLKKQDTFGPVPPKEQEVKPEVQNPKIERVDTAHFNQPKVAIQQQQQQQQPRRNSSQNTSTEIAQSIPSSKPSNSEFNFKQNMQRLIQIQNELKDGTGSTLTRLTSPQNVSTTQEHYLESSQDGDDRSRKAHEKSSIAKYNTSHHPQRVYGPQEPNLDVTEDEIEEEPLYEPSANRKPVPRESYPGNLSIKRNLNESDEFMESTMDEKALAAFIKQSGNSRKAFPVKVNQQFTEKPSKHPHKGVSFVDEPSYFVTQQNTNLEETMAYDSVNNSFHPQSIIRNKINRPEVDQLADTMKSTDFEAVPDFRKMYENLSQKPGAQGVASAGEIWREASSDIAKGDYEAAYSKVLDAGDDIYLLRLLKITGSCMQKLNRGTALRLMKRIIVLQKSNFFDKMALSFFESAQKTRVLHNMKIEDQNLMLKELYKMSAKPSLLGETAANLHEVVTLDLKTTYL